MKIDISTAANGGHLICYLMNSNSIKMLTLKDGETGNCSLVPGNTYRFEWHVWSDTNANYAIKAKVDPANIGFPDFDWKKQYDKPLQDMGGFYFSV